MFAINYKMSLLTSLSTFLPSVTGQAEDREPKLRCKKEITKLHTRSNKQINEKRRFLVFYRFFPFRRVKE